MKPVFRLLGAAALAVAVAAGGVAIAQKGAAPKGGANAVDLELVLAVDISRSMDEQEHALQRDGYVQAFRHDDVIQALLAGPHGKIAVTYMEWASGTYQIIPWTIIDSKQASLAFAQKLADEPVNGESRTSISNALYAAEKLIDENDITSSRRAIDVSGDGANNSGGPIEEARDFVIKQGITINGLPILLEQNDNVGGGGGGGFGGPGGFGRGFITPHLDRYYKGCVIGGQGAFIAPVFSLQQLSATIRKKLVLEIAGLDSDPGRIPGTAPVQYAEAETPDAAGLKKVQLKLPAEKPDCLVGEKQRGGRGGYGGDFGPPPPGFGPPQGFGRPPN